MKTLIVFMSSIALLIMSGCAASQRMLTAGQITDCGTVGAIPDTKVVTVNRDGSLSGDVQEGIVYFDKAGQTVTWQHATSGESLDIEVTNRNAFAKTSTGNDRKTLRVNNARGNCAAYKYTIKLSTGDIDPVIIVRY